jgi:Zn2+/Cd2+-exporting ATPase
MDCLEEVAAVRRALGPVVGGEERLSFDVLTGRMTVDLTDTSLGASTIIAAVASTGLRADPWVDGLLAPDVKASSAWNRGILWTSLSGGFLLIGVMLGTVAEWQGFTGPAIPILERSAFGLAILCGLRLVAPKALSSARRLRPDMNLLMTVAVLGAVMIGEYLEAASVAFLFALSNALEAWSIRRAHRAISALMDLTPPTARTVDPQGVEKTRPLEEVLVHSRIIVKPGERIPLDGDVVAGSSHVNQAPITGESIPVGKQVGDSVFAGTVNGNGALEIETTKAAGDTTVAHIVRLIEQARTQRSPKEQWVDQFARVYTPSVMAVALFVFVIPPLLFGQAWGEWFYRGLVLLVIACPCALVISTPVSVVAALAAAASQGVLVKGGIHLEAPGRLKAVAFDKTGTLTEGRPSVLAVIPLHGHEETQLLERAASLEARSDHPLAKAILDYARHRGVPVRPANNYQEIPGKGATGEWNSEAYWLGSVRLLQERAQDTPEVQEQIAGLAAQGQTVVVVGNNRHACGLLALADTVRPSSRPALAGLRAMGVSHIVMLTGDSHATAQAIGNQLGVDDIRAELLPAEKLRVVEELVARFGTVAMVGDGVNDAPALATASLGIAMGVAGSDAAIESADIALMSNDLAKLPWLVSLSRRTVRIIQQNISFSLGVKALFAILTLLGASTLWGAIAADMGASLLVIFNGLRLLQATSTQ